jgi:hypothetical protein
MAWSIAFKLIDLQPQSTEGGPRSFVIVAPYPPERVD